MKRWLPFASLFLFLFIWVAGCGGDDVRDDGDDDTTQDSGVTDARADGAGFVDGSTEDGSVRDGSTPDGSISDAGTDSSVVDSGNDSGILDAGQDAAVDAGQDAGADAGTFDVTGATATNATTVVVTFDAVPDLASAQTSSNYVITGGTTAPTVTNAVLSGNQVTLTTSTQEAAAYTLTVSNVVRSSDMTPLTVATAAFTGVTTFNIISAKTTSATTIDLTFDAPPNATQAQTTGNYTVIDASMTPATILTASVLGNVVTLTTMGNLGPVGYMVTVAGVTRDSDGAALTTDHVSFAGPNTFNVSSAVAVTSTSLTVTFSDAPDQTTAETTTNYLIMDAASNPLNVTAATLLGNVVTLTTDAQAAVTYTVKVINVVRNPGAVALYADMAQLTGIAAGSAPTVTNVVVTATLPDNGTTPYNTGTTTVTLTGTGFTGVDCATTIGVKLDDLDGAGAAVGTQATSCGLVNDTSLSATFPAGIRTNGTTGWNVIVTNPAGSNTTSTVAFVPVAGLLISEVLIGTGANALANDEFVEVYNPTAATIDTGALGLALHQRSGTGGDTGKPLTLVSGHTKTIASHGYLLLASSASTAETWFSKVDLTYSAAFGGNGGAYISLSGTKDVNVLDKLGWGTQPPGGFEGTALANLTNNNSGQRNAGTGTLVDTDSNVDDFTISGTITPKGTGDGTGP